MPTINNLTRTDTVSAGDVVPVYIQNQGDARGAAMSVLLAYIQGSLEISGSDFVTQYALPAATGFSVQINNTSENTHLILSPSSSFATGTIVLPLSSNLIEGQQVMVTTTQPVAALTVSPNGASIIGAPAGLITNQTFLLKYDSASFTWYMVGNSVQMPLATGGPLGTPSSGVLTNCTGLPVSTGISGLAANIETFLATPSSANLLAALTDETGTGSAVFAVSPTLTGIPLAPTGILGANTQQVANMAALQNRILGTVAQVAGVPTGTILERGSNSNGEYVKMADGTLICTKTVAVESIAVTTAYASLFQGLTALWTFPVAFVGNVPFVDLTPYSSGKLAWPSRGAAASLVSAQMAILDVTSATSNYQLSYFAIGRWF